MRKRNMQLFADVGIDWVVQPDVRRLLEISLPSQMIIPLFRSRHICSKCPIVCCLSRTLFVSINLRSVWKSILSQTSVASGLTTSHSAISATMMNFSIEKRLIRDLPVSLHVPFCLLLALSRVWYVPRKIGVYHRCSLATFPFHPLLRSCLQFNKNKTIYYVTSFSATVIYCIRLVY